jgi:2-aminoethylphosphonate-pyruvate transaminase
MNYDLLPPNPYLLLTPGPLSTSKTVKAAMLTDWCTWDDDYNLDIVQRIREKLVSLATETPQNYTSILMQGSGTFSVESVIGTVIPCNGKLLVISNGAYGQRMAKIAGRLGISCELYDVTEVAFPDLSVLGKLLTDMPEITHMAVVHCETTTGILNPVREILDIAKLFGKITIVDAMSSFGGIPMDVHAWQIDFLISSANKCIQGVPGFGFIIARTEELILCNDRARSLSLDLYDQWLTTESGRGKWRFTSPTHVVRAFLQALHELEEEGGIEKRYERYSRNQKVLAEGMRFLGFKTLLPDEMQSPIITSFLPPSSPAYSFQNFYHMLKKHGFVIYPGKISSRETFRIGNIGEIYMDDIHALLKTVSENMFWK